MTHSHSMPFGATVLADGAGVLFQLWAPGVAHVELDLAHRATADAGADDTARATQRAMARGDDGWHRLSVSDARAGDRYRFVLPDGLRVPDPASRRAQQCAVSCATSKVLACASG